jgi:hypothetical protein
MCTVWVSLFLVCGCTNADSDLSAWSTAERGFLALTASDGDAERFFAQETYPNTLQLRDQRTRYTFQRIEQLRFTAGDAREGAAAINLDGWPISIPFKMERVEGRWLITGLTPGDSFRRARALLGPHGLPQVEKAPEWRGGLNGRDAEGRPHSAILITIVGGEVSIDGGPSIPYRETQVKTALRASIEHRHKLARQAKSTYRPHVALGLRRQSPVLMTLDLIDWTVEAGAELVQLLVRHPNGQPGAFILGRIVERPQISHDALHLRALWSDARLTARREGQNKDLISEEAKAVNRFADALRPLSSRAQGGTILLQVTPTKTHGSIVDLLSALHQSTPNLKVGVESLP